MSRIDRAIELAARRMGKKERDQPEERPAEPCVSITPDRSKPPRVDVSPVQLQSEQLVAFHEPNGLAAEEYKRLFAQIQQAAPRDSHTNTLLVTSSAPGEGKSLTAANLSISLARQLDHSVLLIDADLRRPHLHDFFGIPKGPGLVQILEGECEFADAIVHTGLGKLAVLPAGDPINNPLELISSKQMKAFVEDVKVRYEDRYVLFDSPPVHSFADAGILGSLVDGVIYIVREKAVSLVEVQEGLEQLKGSNILGMVYNAAVNRTRFANGGYGYDYQG